MVQQKMFHRLLTHDGFVQLLDRKKFFTILLPHMKLDGSGHGVVNTGNRISTKTGFSIGIVAPGCSIKCNQPFLKKILCLYAGNTYITACPTFEGGIITVRQYRKRIRITLLHKKRQLLVRKDSLSGNLVRLHKNSPLYLLHYRHSTPILRRCQVIICILLGKMDYSRTLVTSFTHPPAKILGRVIKAFITTSERSIT